MIKIKSKIFNLFKSEYTLNSYKVPELLKAPNNPEHLQGWILKVLESQSTLQPLKVRINTKTKKGHEY